MQETVDRPATYADLKAVPPHLVAEILFGRLVTHPRPSPPHSVTSLSLGSELTGPFQKGRGGPGGWVFANEPELHLGPHIMVPDLAGWRRERMPHLPKTAYIEIAPDWVCELLSPSTEAADRGVKRRLYGEFGVRHLWHLDPVTQLLEVFELRDRHWLLLEVFQEDEVVRAPPFEAISFAMTELFPLPPEPTAG